MPASHFHPRRTGGRFVRRAQSGVSLIIVLMILLVITVLGIGGAELTLQGERSTRNDRDMEIARQAAELALDDAELDIEKFRSSYFQRDNEAGFAAGCSSDPTTVGLCQESPPGTKPVWATAFDDDTKTVPYGSITGQSNNFFGHGIQSAQAPRYIIESTQDSDSCSADASTDLSGSTALYGCRVLRITAMGYGPDPDTKVVMQTEFRLQ